MPIWYGPDEHIFCEENEDEAKAAAKEFYGHEVELRRETDVLDTWFSSGLWAFSTLGWPDKTEFLDTFYPTSVLITGFDIIFFWVARMMMMSMYMMKKIPFRTVYLHGLVRDEQGHKMSKSKGNTVDPLKVIDTYGADALRFFMAAMETQGRDVNMSEARVAGYRNFATKLWNAARFGEMNEVDYSADCDIKSVKSKVNRWIIAKAKKATFDVSKSLNDFRFSDAANAVYQFAWGDFCDWYIEMIKPVLYGDDEAAKTETKAVFAWVLRRIMIILHPFMPFITTQIWQNLQMGKAELMLQSWPKEEADNEQDSAAVDWVIEVVSKIRSLRAEMNLPAGAKIKAYYKDVSADMANNTTDMKGIVCALARLEEFADLHDGISSSMAQIALSDGVVLLELEGVMDFAAELERLKKNLAQLEKNLQGYAAKLSNPAFVEKAPQKVVEEEKKRQAEALAAKAKVEAAIAQIENLGNRRRRI